MTTIYTQEPGYHIQQTVGGWVVVYIRDNDTCSTVDGGRVHSKRKNAYARAKRLNDRLKHLLLKYGMAEAYFDNYTVRVDEGYDPGSYALTVQKDAMPPHFLQTCTSFAELEEETRSLFFPQPIKWQRVKSE